MCSDFKAIKILKSLLKHQDKWELTCFTPKDMEEIGLKSKLYADKKLSSISLLSLWTMYKKWRKEPIDMKNSEDYFYLFIAQVAHNIALENLKGLEWVTFYESCYFKFKFK